MQQESPSLQFFIYKFKNFNNVGWNTYCLYPRNNVKYPYLFAFKHQNPWILVFYENPFSVHPLKTISVKKRKWSNGHEKNAYMSKCVCMCRQLQDICPSLKYHTCWYPYPQYTYLSGLCKLHIEWLMRPGNSLNIRSLCGHLSDFCVQLSKAGLF